VNAVLGLRQLEAAIDLVLFQALGIERHTRNAKVVMASVSWNYTTFLNIAFCYSLRRSETRPENTLRYARAARTSRPARVAMLGRERRHHPTGARRRPVALTTKRDVPPGESAPVRPGRAETLVHAPDNVLSAGGPSSSSGLGSHQNRASEVRLSHELPASFSSSVRIV